MVVAKVYVTGHNNIKKVVEKISYLGEAINMTHKPIDTVFNWWHDWVTQYRRRDYD